MALASGLAGQFGFVAETTWGTPVTVTRFVPLVDESVALEIDRLESEGIIAGARVLRSQQWSAGMHRVGGDVGLEVYDRTVGLLLHHAMGSWTTASTQAPYSHVFTPGDLTGLGLTMQFGRPDRTGTVRPFTYEGCKIASWEIAVAAGEIATMGLTVVGQAETTGITLASATYSNSIAPMTYVGGSFSLAGSGMCVRSARIMGDNALTTDRTCVGQATIDEPLETGLREYTGEVEVEFTNLTHYNRFLDGSEAALSLALVKGSASLTINANVRTDGATPHIEGRDMLVHTLSFKCVGTNSDSSAISMTFVNSDSVP